MGLIKTPELYLKQYQYVYPNILKWFEKRVLVDLASGIKVIFLVEAFYEVIGLTIVDLAQGKVCHLSISTGHRGDHLTGRYLLQKAEQTLIAHGHLYIWAHGPEYMAGRWTDWAGAGWQPVTFLNKTFSRDDNVRDIKVAKVIPKNKRIIVS